MKMLGQHIKFVFLLLSVMVLSACSHTAPAPVVDLNTIDARNSTAHLTSLPRITFTPSTNTNQEHLVKPGETLFSIAWRYSLDYRIIATNNGITGNRIYPGQKLDLREPNTSGLAFNQISKPPAMAGKPFRTENLLAAINREVLHKKAPMQRSHPFISKSDQSARVTNKSIATNKTKNKNNKKTNSSVKQKSVVTKNTRVAISDSSTPIKHWIWPVNGKVISRFSNRSNMNKGLDIAAKKGTPVRATAKGRVVYSGRGLRGYGQLVIIKHNDQFLSAYAHNDKIHVEENEVVKAGQRIAELGNTDSDKDKLHFEIRLKGKPVDPLNYLPKSGLM